MFCPLLARFILVKITRADVFECVSVTEECFFWHYNRVCSVAVALTEYSVRVVVVVNVRLLFAAAFTVYYSHS